MKTPVLPDQASRAKLTKHTSSKFTEEYADYLHLGYLEWRKTYDEMAKLQKKAVLFVMTDDTGTAMRWRPILRRAIPNCRARCS